MFKQLLILLMFLSFALTANATLLSTDDPRVISTTNTDEGIVQVLCIANGKFEVLYHKGVTEVVYIKNILNENFEHEKCHEKALTDE